MKNPLAHKSVIEAIHVGGRHIWFPVAGILMPIGGPLSQSQADGVVHAVTCVAVKEAHERQGTPVAVCGAVSRVRLVETPDHYQSIIWPPRVAEIKAEGLTRCLECHRLTGKPRPA